MNTFRESKGSKIILDSDMGHMNDDTLALTLLLQAETRGEIELLGITLCGGNTFILADYENFGKTQYHSRKETFDFLQAVGRKNLPVLSGSDFPLGYGPESVNKLVCIYREYTRAGIVHKRRYRAGDDAYGIIHFWDRIPVEHMCCSEEAVEFLIDQTRRYPGMVTILAIGPTQNIARAIEKDPDFASRTAGIVYMGGAFGEPEQATDTIGRPMTAIGGSNTTAFAEYNVFFDPESFFRCVTAPFPKQIIGPGDLSASADPKTVRLLEAANNRYPSAAANCWLAYYREGLPTIPYWDPVTTAALLSPDRICESVEVRVTVDHDPFSEHYGETSVISEETYRGLPTEQQRCYGKATILRKFSRFWEYAIDMMCGVSDANAR